MILINKKISNLCGIIYIGTGLSKLAGWKLLTMILLLFVIIIISVSMFLRYKSPEKYAKKGETALSAPMLLTIGMLAFVVCWFISDLNII